MTQQQIAQAIKEQSKSESQYADVKSCKKPKTMKQYGRQLKQQIRSQYN